MTDFEKYSLIFTYNPETGELRWRKGYPGKTGGLVAGAACKDKGGNFRYWGIALRGKSVRAHRIAWLLYYGAWPKYEIDHIDGNPLNNRIHNLRDVDHATNKKNNRNHQNNKTGRPGVWWSERDQEYKVYINSDGRREYLPSTPDFFEACCIRKATELKYGFHENHGRVAI